MRIKLNNFTVTYNFTNRFHQDNCHEHSIVLQRTDIGLPAPFLGILLF
jgi:hypothetical protein